MSQGVTVRMAPDAVATVLPDHSCLCMGNTIITVLAAPASPIVMRLAFPQVMSLRVNRHQAHPVEAAIA